MDEGSPLATTPREQARLPWRRLPGVRVEVAMRYGQPSIGSVWTACTPGCAPWRSCRLPAVRGLDGDDDQRRPVDRRNHVQLGACTAPSAAPAYIEGARDRP